jgi:hypothetical protein
MSVDPNVLTSDAASAAGTTTNGSGAAISDSGSGQANASATGGQAAPSSDYLAKIASDAAFAQQEVTKHQSRADQAEAKARAHDQWLAGLEEFRERGFSGADIAAHLKNYSRALGNPQMAQAINEFLQTGEMPRGANRNPGQGSDNVDDDDAYLTDEQKEIRSLRAELQSLRGEVTRNVASTGQQALKTHFENVASELGLQGERFERVRKTLIDQVEQWKGAGDSGRAAIAQLQTPDGERTVRALVHNALPTSELLEVAGEQYLRQKQKRGELATDSPSPFSTTGKEAPPEIDDPVKALEYARANPEKMREIYGDG